MLAPAQIISIAGIVIGSLMIVAGFYLIRLDTIQKIPTTKGLIDVPETIKEFGNLLKVPGAIGMIFVLIGSFMVVICVLWWLYPEIIPDFVERLGTPTSPLTNTTLNSS